MVALLCNRVKLRICLSGGGDNGKKPIVSVKGETLFRSDIEDALPVGVSGADSIAMAKAYMEMWIKNQLIYDKAQQNTLSKENIESLVKDYRKTLVINFYQEQLLQEQYPNYRLQVLDAARPVSVQRIMWDAVKGTPNNIYVANPNKTGLHNYGTAVDVSITNDLGVPLDMGTPFDYFGEEAQPAKEEQMLKEGKLTQQQLNNRKILRSVMNRAGFLTYRREWWHFNACKLSEAKSRYQVIP